MYQGAGKPQFLLHTSGKSSCRPIPERSKSAETEQPVDPRGAFLFWNLKEISIENEVSMTVRSWYKPKRCGMYAMCSLIVPDLQALKYRPPTLLRRLDRGFPASMRMVVVFPAPSGPTMPKSSPRFTSRFRLLTARVVPKSRHRSFVMTIGPFGSCSRCGAATFGLPSLFDRLFVDQDKSFRRHAYFQLLSLIRYGYLDSVNLL